MTKISNEQVYINDLDITDLDYIIGTDGDTTKKQTKTFLFGRIKDYILAGLSPETGGILKITEIKYTGDDYDNPADFLNSLSPSYQVERYHFVIVNMLDGKYIFKLQNVKVGENETPVVNEDFINIQGKTGIGISNIVKTNTVGLVDTYTITYSDSTTSTFNVTNGANGTNGINGTDGADGNGIVSLIKTNTVGLVDTYTITFTDSSTTNFNVTNGADGTDSENLQKVLVYPTDFTGTNYTLLAGDNNYSIKINNGATAVTIIVPSGLPEKFFSGITQKGTADVGFVGSGGVSISNPVGLKIKGQGYCVGIEQIGSSNAYDLLADTKA